MSNKYIKENLRGLKGYTSARDLYNEGVFLDANENPIQWVDVDYSKLNNLNRYPDSKSREVRRAILDSYLRRYWSLSKEVTEDNVFFGAGSDEIIDLLIRGFVEDDESIMVMSPSYSVYEIQANIYNLKVEKVLLKPDFSLDMEEILKTILDVKLIFLCSPNNPTGNILDQEKVETILDEFEGLVIMDEAYIEFADWKDSFIELVERYENLVILRTFSKAWGLAGIRAGYCLASKEVIETLMKIKDAYNISKPTQSIVLQALEQIDGFEKVIKYINEQKEFLLSEMKNYNFQVYNTKANFILLKIDDASKFQKKLASKGMIIRDRSNLPYLENTLRISIGDEEQNLKLIQLIKEISNE